MTAPEVRQCQDPEDDLFGAVAVASTGLYPWGVMHPLRGGHWSTDEDVATWVIQQSVATAADQPRSRK